jgi:Ca-activated chloride channel homolog
LEKQLMTQHLKISIFFALLFNILWAHAEDLNLKVELAEPVVSISTPTQKNYLKISLTGIKREQAADRSPVNVALVIDKSGSMSGKKIQQAIEAGKLAISLLNKHDIVALVSYDSDVTVMSPATKLTNSDILAKALDNLRAGGSTALYGGVDAGAKELRKFLSKNMVNRVILLSDGIANVGPDSVVELGDLGKKLGKEGISVTTIGLGSGFNEDLMTALANYSDGNHAFVANADDLAKAFEQEFGDVLSVVAQDVELEIRLKNGSKPIKLLGREATIEDNTVRAKLNQLYSAQEKYLLLEITPPPGKDKEQKPVAAVQVRYHSLSENKPRKMKQEVAVRYSSDMTTVKKARNESVMADATIQQVNEANAQAILLRDKGKVKEAQKLLKANAVMLRSSAATAPAPKAEEMKKLAEEYEQDMQVIESEKAWNMQRKSMKARGYKLKKQQK